MTKSAEIDRRAGPLLERVRQLIERVDGFDAAGQARIRQIRERTDDMRERAGELIGDVQASHTELAQLLAETSRWVFDSEAALSGAGAALASGHEGVASDGEGADGEVRKLIGVLDDDGPAAMQEVGQRIARWEAELRQAVDATKQASGSMADASAQALGHDAEALAQAVGQVSERLAGAVQATGAVIGTEAAALKTAMAGSFGLMRDAGVQLVSATGKAVHDTATSLESSVAGAVHDLQATCAMVTDTCTQLADLSRGAADAAESTNQGMQVAAQLVEKVKRLAEEIEDAFA
jgi:hypothetical protein